MLKFVKRSVRRLVAWSSEGESGFSLMELLVAIGIMAAIAAITIPLVTRFASSGTSGAKTSEKDTIQTAIDTYIAGNNINTLPSGDVPTSSQNDFTAGAGKLDLTGYMRATSTKYFYCWTNTGGVNQQDDATASCP